MNDGGVVRVSVMRGVFGEGSRGNFEDENGERSERRIGEEIGGESRFGGGEEMG